MLFRLFFPSRAVTGAAVTAAAPLERSTFATAPPAATVPETLLPHAGMSRVGGVVSTTAMLQRRGREVRPTRSAVAMSRVKVPRVSAVKAVASDESVVSICSAVFGIAVVALGNCSGCGCSRGSGSVSDR